MTTRRGRSTVLDYLLGFQSYLETSAGLSARTQEAYTAQVRQFAEAVDNPALEDLTPGLLLSWLVALHQKGTATATMVQKRAAVKRFLRYLVRFEKRPDLRDALDSFDELAVPKQAMQGREAYRLTDEQVDKMVQAAGRLHPGVGVRDQHIIRLGVAAALRRSELVDLEMDWLDLDERMVKIVGKGGKERFVPLAADTCQHLRSWLETRKSWPVKCGKVFITAGGNRMDPGEISRMVKAAGEAAGLRKPVWAHLMRHTGLTNVFDGGMPLQEGQLFAGHNQVSTTMLYYHKTPQGLRESFDRVTRRGRRTPPVPPETQEVPHG